MFVITVFVMPTLIKLMLIVMALVTLVIGLFHPMGMVTVFLMERITAHKHQILDNRIGTGTE